MKIGFSKPFSIKKDLTEYINIKGYSIELTYKLEDVKEITIDIFYKDNKLNLMEQYIYRDVNNKLSKDNYIEVYSFRGLSFYIKRDPYTYLFLTISIKEILVLHKNKETNISYYCLSGFHDFNPYKYKEYSLKESIDTKELRASIGYLSQYNFDKKDKYIIIPNGSIKVYKSFSNNLYKLDKVSLNFLYWQIDSNTVSCRLLEDNFIFKDIWKSLGTQVNNIIPQPKVVNPEEEDHNKYLYLI